MAVNVHWWVTFGDGAGGGNPAPIVLGADRLDTAEMQSIAAELGFETVFVTAPSEGGASRLRFFVPRYEVDMCGHGTIAALTLLRSRGAIPSSGFIETASGPRRFHESRQGMMLQLGQLERFNAAPPPDETAATLRIEPAQIGGALGPVTNVSVARANIIIPLADQETLDQLQPDLERLWDLCQRYGSTGAYVCAPASRAPFDVLARGFPLDVGYPEDPATGTAAGALAAELSCRGILPADPTAGFYRIAQGHAIRRPSLIHACAPNAADPHAWIGGRAEATDRLSLKDLA